MNSFFENRTWSLDLTPPWRMQDHDTYLEITQPEGAGVMRISDTRKNESAVPDAVILENLKRSCPKDIVCERVRCGDFEGYRGDYVDWATSRSWHIWSIASGSDLLSITYTCWRGEEELEAEDAAALLQALRSRP